MLSISVVGSMPLYAWVCIPTDFKPILSAQQTPLLTQTAIFQFINPPQDYLSANLLTTLYLCSSWLCTHFHQKPRNPQQQSSCPTYQREYTSNISGIAQRYQSRPVMKISICHDENVDLSLYILTVHVT